MPTYHVEMLEGRTIEQKKKLVQEITRVTVEVLGGSAASVDVLITDVKHENWATGGVLWSEPRPKD
jgi:4-oxalocrotonate tautomerase